MKSEATEKGGEMLDGKTNGAEKVQRDHLPGKMLDRPVTATVPLNALLYEVQTSIPLHRSRQRQDSKVFSLYPIRRCGKPIPSPHQHGTQRSSLTVFVTEIHLKSIPGLLSS